jgi:hypothetical protein
MDCECGFKFSKLGEFRNSNAFITSDGESGVICPKCGNKYIGNKKVIMECN